MKIKIASLAFTIALSLYKSLVFGQQTIAYYPSLLWPLTEVYNSQSKVHGDLRGYRAMIILPEDNRSHFYGEHFYRWFKIEPLNDSTSSFDNMNAIVQKISYDIDTFGSYQNINESSPKLTISPSVEVFQSAAKGNAWFTCFAKVRLTIQATLNDSVIVNKKYESFCHMVTGFSEDWEGEVFFGHHDQCTKVTLGITLRKALDQFYSDLFLALSHRNNSEFTSILFSVGTTDIAEDSYVNLDNALHTLQSDSKIQIELDGYTDIAGDAGKDLDLAQRRVEKIKSYLIHNGIYSHRIKCKALGAVHPIGTNSSESSRRLNRRVEFVIVKK